MDYNKRIKYFNEVIFAVFVTSLLVCSSGHATTFKSSVFKDRDGTRIEFQSTYGNNVFGDVGEKINAFGYLWMPKNIPENAKVPLLIIAPGMGGQKGRDARMCSAVAFAGIACFGIRPYPSRNIDKKLSAQEKLMKAGFASRIADVYGALEVLASNQQIDINRAWLGGMSAGGTTAGLATVEEITKPFQKSKKDFKGFFAMYGPCLPVVNGKHKKALFKAYWAELDWVYDEQACKEMVEKMKIGGVEASSHFFEGKVGHSWDHVWYDKKRGGWRKNIPANTLWDNLAPDYAACKARYDVLKGKILYADNQETLSFSGVTGWDKAVEVCGVMKGKSGPNEQAARFVEEDIISIILAN